MFGFRRHRRSVPYDMFDLGHHGLAAKNARVLERVYHKAHTLGWDGKEVLESLFETHGLPQLPDAQKAALGRLFGIIMWGELAAWRISAELADEIEPLEAKMAATSQAFDEARHFYVMHDYLVALDALPDKLDRFTQRLLEDVMNADHLAKKLVGMQLMVEPVALTLFHLVKKLEIEPVLTHLLPYYERDEARHIALGVQYLPSMIARMSVRQRLSLWAYQLKLMTYELLSSRDIQRDLHTLGVDPRELVAVGKGKQMRAVELVFGDVDQSNRLAAGLSWILERYTDTLTEAIYYKPERETRAEVAARVWRVLKHGSDIAPEGDLDPQLEDADTPLATGLRGRRPRASA